MMLTRFWRALELLVSQATVTDEWRLCLGQEFEMAARYLRPTNTLGCCYPRSNLLEPQSFRRCTGYVEQVSICSKKPESFRFSTILSVLYVYSSMNNLQG